MRQLFSPRLTMVLICTLSVLYTKAIGTQTTTVTCQLNKKIGSAVFLYRVNNGEAVSLGFKWLNDKNACTFTFDAEKEGIYYLRRAGAHSSFFNYCMYLTPGDVKTVQVYISDKSIDFDSCQIVNPKKETGYLQQWTNLLNNICKLGTFRTKREEFFPAFDAFVRKAESLKKECAATNATFCKIFNAKIDADIQFVKAGAFFYFTERMNGDRDTDAKHQSFYSSLLNDKLSNAGYLASEHGMQIVNYVLGYRKSMQSADPLQWWAVPFAEKMNQIGNEMLKATYVANYLKSVTSYEQFKTDIEPYQELMNKTGYDDEYEIKLDEVTVFAKGADGYNFSLPNTRNKLVSLVSLKGKVVVIDMWAMWCASCLQEKPFYEKLAEEYKDRNDIVFVGVSVDGEGKKAPWKDFVARKGYKTMELLAEPSGGLMSYYKIAGIPRYLVFDKDGKIVTVDAPRPSTSGLKKLIDQTLSNTAK
ncbi:MULTISPECIES: TlpA family protein disulfide reductase [Niastella]|uniref:TlpA family protein disulfide reductase n=1 Tax=Niastella soli TaxID=2821487 RepID=A0ABS3Z3I7_9BACT|nr:TlpA disulfide reductase family protein [Niastella soli]MBO9204699.1 TlpA family protein disulfide reductase [Niastella soli]